MKPKAATQAAAVWFMIATAGAFAQTTDETTRIIDRKDIELSGARTVFEVVFGLGSENGLGTARAVVAGSSRTAVLVDRRPSSAGALALIPLSTVERIEIWSEGGTVRHGTAHVGGTVNVVTRHGHEGIEASGSRGAAGTDKCRPSGEEGSGMPTGSPELTSATVTT